LARLVGLQFFAAGRIVTEYMDRDLLGPPLADVHQSARRKAGFF